MNKQRTIEKEVSLSGVGLHTASKVKMKFKPADIDTGIVFVRTDLPSRPKIKVCIDSLLDQSRSPRRTSLGCEGAEIHTIEHLMAALSGLNIDNILIEIDNNEIPGMDGSSLSFFDSISQAGIREQEGRRKYCVIREPVMVEEEGCSIIALPHPEFKISYTLDYNHVFLKTDFFESAIDKDTFLKEFACARTFCLEEEAEQLKSQGMGGGADYDNTLVVGRAGVIKNKLRFENEFIRHKILDLIGDLYILSKPIKGHIIALKSGHSLNLKMVKKIAHQEQRYGLSAIGIDYHPKEGEELDAETIMKILPHRPPFLFVDRVVHLERGKSARGIKNVTINDYFFDGHFPGRPVMPGVLIIEAMAQVGGVMMLSTEENRGKLAYFMAANNIKFRKTVVPGDQLVIDVEAGRIRARTGQVHARAMVDAKVVVEADFVFALADK
ncbi:MAG: bifunctional UDP-3-O-[3-hydroxymyristoyl] N-acetylglucosamine deacetylase/3-hydroxyacyl-ACP dehydratase [Candidatus Omnitrophica bacterium]|nr:bifunctional UDP-3-O-[3-hydroxymyristoyl] N-acetylglucosamine deacetylase/3-hydroxyacyl-ACP dehydratase [Candidatus Omnitrophota bacterium]